MKILITILAFIFLPVALWAQTFADRANVAYLATDKNYDLDCFYSFNENYKLIEPVSSTVKGANFLSRDFTISTLNKKIPMSFKVVRTEKGVEYSILMNGVHESKGKIKRNEFFIMPIADRAFANEFETHRMLCQVNFAYAKPFELKDGDYHINVHPHTIYDWQSRIKNQTESYLNDPRFESILLLETGNDRGNLVSYEDFFNGVDYKLPQKHYESDLVLIPEHVPFIVSPAGNSRYDIKAQNQINITLTGGNHNYCIWNVTRHVLENLMKSTVSPKLHFIYDTNAIVAQQGGMEKVGINFSRQSVRRSNLLKDLLSDEDVQQSYHPNYLGYFKGYLARQFAGMYKTYTIHYKAPGYTTTVVLNGKGTRDLEVTMEYR